MSTRPQPCESCAAGKHRAYCHTFPRPCEDLLEIWDQGREEALRECGSICEPHGSMEVQQAGLLAAQMRIYALLLDHLEESE